MVPSVRKEDHCTGMLTAHEFVDFWRFELDSAEKPIPFDTQANPIRVRNWQFSRDEMMRKEIDDNS